MMNIGLDFGDTIVDTARLKAALAMDLYGKTILPEKFNREYVVGNALLTPRQYKALQVLIYRTPEFGFEELLPIEESFEVIRKLKKEKENLKIVSERGTLETRIAKKWLKEKGITLPFVSVGYQNSKKEACAGLDVYLDDDLEHLEELGNVPNRFLFCYRTNKETAPPRGIVKVFSWSQFYEEIQNLRLQEL